MRTLILSATAGQGHNSCAAAIREAFEAHGDTCVVEDAFALISKKLSQSIAKNHEKQYRESPQLSNAGYRFLERHPGLFSRKNIVYQVMSIGRKQISRCIREGGYDTVICTHVLPAMMLTAAMQHEDIQVKSAFIATDYSCSPGVNGTALDRYFIPHESLISAFIRAEIPPETIVTSGIPVRSAFAPLANKQDGKRAFGVQPENLHLLVMCGSMGCGPIPQLLSLIAPAMPENWEITVVCGTNAQLYETLHQSYADHQRIHIRGYEKEMPLLLASSDLYLTKPGGLSTAEAAATAVPMVLIDAVSGCEENNLRYFVRIGAAVAGSTAEETAPLCLALMGDHERIEQMRRALANRHAVSAAECIRCEMERLHRL